MDFEDSQARAPSPEPSRPWVTHALLGSIVVAFALQLLAVGDPLLLDIDLGANFTPLVRAGQWDRLVTANWMHSREMLLHIGLNGLGLYLLGRDLEIILGPRRFFVIYVLSCLGGALASTLGNPGMPSLGASTGVVGLFAAIGYVLLAQRQHLPKRMRAAGRQWVLLLLLNIALWVVFSDLGIDHIGHAGGFFAGALASAALTFKWPPFVRAHRGERWAGIVAFALLAVVVTGIGTSAHRYLTTPHDDPSVLRLLIDGVIEREGAEPHLLNLLAWSVAISERAAEEHLERAVVASERAIASLPEDATGDERAALRDTLATLHYRLGQYAEAVRIERAVYASESEPMYASQLARFLQAALADGVPLGALDEAQLPTVGLEPGGDGLSMGLALADPPADGMVFFVLALDADGALVGLLRASLAPGRKLPASVALSDELAATAELRLALVESPPEPTPRASFGLVQVPMSEEVAGWP